jgi:hypothetical protein
LINEGFLVSFLSVKNLRVNKNFSKLLSMSVKWFFYFIHRSTLLFPCFQARIYPSTVEVSPLPVLDKNSAPVPTFSPLGCTMLSFSCDPSSKVFKILVYKNSYEDAIRVAVARTGRNRFFRKLQNCKSVRGCINRLGFQLILARIQKSTLSDWRLFLRKKAEIRNNGRYISKIILGKSTLTW